MKTDLEAYMDGLKEQGIEFLRGGDNTNIEIIVGNKVRVFNADGSDQNTESSASMAEMPRYQCHKKVWALKIAKIQQGDDRDTFLTMHFVEKFSPITMDLDWFMKHNPEEGGYYVVYQDGYKSFSPAEAFEGGYTLISNLIRNKVTAKPIEWEHDSKNSWSDPVYGVHIYFDPDDKPGEQYVAAWGEGDSSSFGNLEEAKEWCQLTLNTWVAKVAELPTAVTFEEVARPVIEWMNENCNPHQIIQIDLTSAQLFEGVNALHTEDYLRG